jgi:hypothetical protein
MKWTHATPKKPGFYWKKPSISGEPFLVRVELTPITFSGISATLVEHDFFVDISRWDHTEWCGPLEPPQ